MYVHFPLSSKQFKALMEAPNLPTAILNCSISLCTFPVQPDRGAKRPRDADGGAAGGDDDVRGGKHLKGLSARDLARYREMAGLAAEAGIDLRESDEMREDRKKILEKLMDQDEDDPEVSSFLNDK